MILLVSCPRLYSNNSDNNGSFCSALPMKTLTAQGAYKSDTNNIIIITHTHAHVCTHACTHTYTHTHTENMLPKYTYQKAENQTTGASSALSLSFSLFLPLSFSISTLTLSLSPSLSLSIPLPLQSVHYVISHSLALGAPFPCHPLPLETVCMKVILLLSPLDYRNGMHEVICLLSSLDSIET